jgi:DNA polymerase-3 subunit gamma/tau
LYQALYRKYRPQTFDDVVGQESVTQVLKSQLISGKLSHAYLFTGSRGTGKTTCSKILAKAVNCLHPVDGNPCNCCTACKSIDDGSCTDVLEIDAASNNGVDNVRGLREDAIYAPAEVKKRVYIIDEVHMLSMSAFNALLKIIEEPPAHLMFILATTELHKVPATILSRCQRFSFRRISPDEIASRIHYVAYEEGIQIDDAASNLLARLADGALRDGLSLLDQCASSSNGPLTAETVYNCLGIAGARKAAELLTAAAEKDVKTALTLLGEQYAEGKDLSALVDELISLSRDLLILKTAPAFGRSMLTGVCTDEELRALLPRFTSGELLRITTLLQQTAAGFQRSANRRIDVELCLVQMCDASLNLDPVSLNARLTRLEESLVSGQFVSAPQPLPAVSAPPEETLPPPQAEEPVSVPPEAASEPPCEELPVGFWADLVTRSKSDLEPSVRGYFPLSAQRNLEPRLNENVLEFVCVSDFVKGIVDTEKTRQVLSQKASAILMRPIQVRFVQKKSVIGGADDPMNQLLQLGRKRPDVIHIRESRK